MLCAFMKRFGCRLRGKAAAVSRMCGDCYDLNYIPDSVREAGVEITSDEGLKSISEAI